MLLAFDVSYQQLIEERKDVILSEAVGVPGDRSSSLG